MATPSEIAKSYGAKSLKEIAEFHGKGSNRMWDIFKRDPDEFDLMCWKWAKANAPYAPFLRRAFIDGVLLVGLPDGNAEKMASDKGYLDGGFGK